MILGEVIKRADMLRPNALPAELKTEFISDLEGALITELFLKPREKFKRYSFPNDEQTRLFVKPPHDSIYLLYLCAMIGFAQQDYAQYQNDMTMYNDSYTALSHWAAVNLEPANDPYYQY